MRKIAAPFIMYCVLALFARAQEKAPDLSKYIEAAKKYDVRILRDKWGVPHVFGKTDADTAFGLAYAHAQDDFDTAYRMLMATRGLVSTIEGMKGYPIDYMARLIRVKETVDAKYESDLSPATRAICEAYADGCNYFVALHPGKADPATLPITGKDIVGGFVLTTPFFYGVQKTLADLLTNEPKPDADLKQGMLLEDYITRGCEVGSNTFAVAPAKSADGFTRLNVNSHQPWEGPVAWYEAHLHSEEGWDMIGGLFPGVPLILHGHNRNLGWAHTVNKPDMLDVYVLKMNPDKPDQYMLDGQWYDLESSDCDVKVKVTGSLMTTISRKCYWSKHHGPVLKLANGAYALRYGGMGEIKQVEQWFRMNKARNFDEFMAALKLQGIPFFNIGYADKAGNIYYLYNAAIPIRAEGYDWSGYVPGDTSRTIWTEYLPLEKLPQVLNPPSGFIQNCNNTPYHTTSDPYNPKPEDFSPTCGIETFMTNRGWRALELFGNDPSITREEFYAYKFDVKYSEKSPARTVVERILALSPVEDPVVQEAIEILRKWNYSVDPENRSAAIAVAVLEPIVRAQMFGRPEPDMMRTITKVAHAIKKRYGRLDVPWKLVNRLRRGKVDAGLGGGPDVLRAIYGKGVEEDGRLTGYSGDSYVLLVEWDKEGKVHSESIHQYGSATLDEKSPHYADQVPLFASGKLKPVWLDESDIRANLEKEYRPGEETKK
ncbi:MAG TPA: acylase [Candidatus Brocadiia bacterium]|nr:acylase [Candidatus Brocadiia bacterium]